MSDIKCSSNSEIIVTIPSCDERCIIYEEENVIDNSSMQHGIWTKSDAEQQLFPFTGRPSLNTGVRVTFWNIFNCFVHQKL
jgi:hypothetical protein